MVKRFSVNLGAVRITENHLTSDPIKPQEVEARWPRSTAVLRYLLPADPPEIQAG